jgi:hypothetical protein
VLSVGVGRSRLRDPAFKFLQTRERDECPSRTQFKRENFCAGSLRVGYAISFGGYCSDAEPSGTCTEGRRNWELFRKWSVGLSTGPFAVTPVHNVHARLKRSRPSHQSPGVIGTPGLPVCRLNTLNFGCTRGYSPTSVGIDRPILTPEMM